MNAVIVGLLLLPILDEDPPLDDRHRFPPKAVAWEARFFNLAFRENLNKHRPLSIHREALWEQAVCEAHHLFLCWDCLDDIQCEGLNEEHRRKLLRKLRVLIGPEAYYSGRMPPCVPAQVCWYVN